MSEVTKAIKQVCEEKGLSYETVLEALEASLGAAYRKDYGNKQQNIELKFDPETGAMQIWDVKTVVEDKDAETLNKIFEEWLKRKEEAQEAGAEFTEPEPERFNPKTELMIKDAVNINPDAKVGDMVRIELPLPGEFGRMAAQTAKQVIMQKLREAERKIMHDEFKEKEGTVVTGIVQRREARGVLVDFGKISGIMPPHEQIAGERYIPGAKIKVLVKLVELGIKGPEIILSRSSADFVRNIFEKEIPEIDSGVVKIMGISREAGFRSKVSVDSEDHSVDPIGACIGQRGGRIQTIIAELGGEKIDVIQYDSNQERYIVNALAPAKVLKVDLNEETKEAVVKVASDQFSLAIGKGGQNVRLACDLTGWKMKVVEEGGTGAPPEGATESAKEGAEEEASNLPNELGEGLSNSDKSDEGLM